VCTVLQPTHRIVDFPHFTILLDIGGGTQPCHIYVEQMYSPNIFITATIGKFLENEKAYMKHNLAIVNELVSWG